MPSMTVTSLRPAQETPVSALIMSTNWTATCATLDRDAVMEVAVRPEMDNAGLSGVTTQQIEPVTRNSTLREQSKETVAMIPMVRDGYPAINQTFYVVYCCAPT